MPFRNIQQLRTCYYDNKWNCDDWLNETTDSICCLSQKEKCKFTIPKNRIKTPVYLSPKGGLYFFIQENNGCVKKIYIKHRGKINNNG